MAQLSAELGPDQVRGIRPDNRNVKWKNKFYTLKRLGVALEKIDLGAVAPGADGTKQDETNNPNLNACIPPGGKLYQLRMSIEAYLAAGGPKVSPSTPRVAGESVPQSCQVHIWEPKGTALLTPDNEDIPQTIDAWDCPIDEPDKAFEVWVGEKDSIALQSTNPESNTLNPITQVVRVVIGQYTLGNPLPAVPQNFEDLDEGCAK